MSDNSDYTVLFARIADAVRMAQRKNAPAFVGFLSEPEAANVRQYLISQDFIMNFGKGVKYCFFGGYENAERLIFASLPDWAESADDIDFPILILKLGHNPVYPLSHRDYLGAIMSLGIERDRVGDIVVSSDGAVIMLHSLIANHVKSQLEKIGRVGITSEFIDEFTDETSAKFMPIRSTVASNRLDCIVAALSHTSREKAVDMITAKLCFVNGIECDNTSKRISNGDVITIRKKGKFMIDSVEDKTKKTRTVLVARQKI